MTAEFPNPGGRHGVGGRPPVQHPAAEPALLVVWFLLCGWMDVRALFLVLLVTTSDYLISARLASASRTRARLLLLSTSVSIDIGLLLIWRAAGVFPGLADLLNGAPFSASGTVKALVPVGLGFFTLRSLGLVIDVYRGVAVPCAAWIRYASFLCFFPAFVAGPISRGNQLLPQLQGGIGLRWDGFVGGSSIFVQGLAKKMLIADRLATIVDPVFANPGLYPPLTVAAGILAYSLQIYCDFAGYSDMAIGAARVLGIDLPRNFDMPYVATDIAEFWHRWHITLSTWLRDYVFLPIAYVGSRWAEELGLSRQRGELLNYAVASVLTMLLAGLWHGSGWGFLLWGGAHGLALATHRVWRGAGGRKRQMPSWLGWALTFMFVSLSWVPFRAASVGDAGDIYGSLLGLGTQRTYEWFPSWFPICAGAVLLGHLATLWITHPRPTLMPAMASGLMKTLGLTVEHRQFAGAYLVPTRVTVPGTYFIVLFILSTLLFAPSKVGPFVYAAF